MKNGNPIAENIPLNEPLIAFIKTHEQEDGVKLLLKAKQFPTINIPFAVQQIEARKKAKLKMPSWWGNRSIIWPVKVSMEQASSELTAQYKASLLKGKSCADLTGGLGVDTFYLSQNFEQSVYYELNDALCRIAKYNFNELGAKNIEVKQGNGVEMVTQNSQEFDLIYLDPSRRDTSKQKVFKLENCTPNLLEIIEALQAKGTTVMAKLSPMLDLKQTIQQFPSLNEIHIVSVENDCKEVLLIFKKENSSPLIINSVALNKEGSSVSETFPVLPSTHHEFNWSSPKEILYEPDVALMKAGVIGGFHHIANRYQLDKLHPNSHLFTSDLLIENFLGRVFKVEKIVIFKKNELKQLDIKKANITARNFPLTVDEIRKKTKWKEGGELYIFATTLLNGQKVLLLCAKL